MTDPQGKTKTAAEQCAEAGCADVTVVVPEGKTLSALTMAELDTASRKLGLNVAKAMADRAHPNHYGSLMLVAWLWAKRSDPKAKTETFEAMSFEQCHHALGMHADDNESGQGSSEDPTSRSADDSEPS